jgi:membrane protein insertase Oxa1/YidC/SpoIIIJ
VAWEAVKPDENSSTIWRKSTPNVEQQMPEVFAQQPQEVDDYIRPDKTMFEKLEDWWDWIIGFMAPVDKQVEMMKWVREVGFFGLQLDYGGVFVIWGAIVRLLTLIPQMYAHRNGLRLAMMSVQLNEITTLEKKTKADKSITSQEKRVINEGYKRMKKALYTKYGCSQLRSSVSALPTPILVTAFLAIRRLATYDEELESCKFLWVTDLTMPDPTYVLPLICTCLFLTNFELNQGMTSGGRGNGKMYMRWGIRVGSLVGLYFFSSQPSACFAYWIGMSTVGLISPILLRNEKFRKYFNFPPRPASSIEQSKYSIWNKILVKMGLKAPPKPEPEKKPTAFSTIHDFEVVFDEEEKKRVRAGAAVANATR